MLLKENEQSNSQWKQVNQRVQKVFFILLLLTGLNASTGYAKDEVGEGLMTIYHIYSDGDYIGELSEAAKIEELVEDELEKVAPEFKNLPLTAGNDLSIIPERVFTAETEDEPILEKVKNRLIVEAKAIAIMVDDESVLYVKDMATYDEVIHNLKLQSVTEQELINVEARQQSTSSYPPLQINQTRITNLVLNKDLQAKPGEVVPEEVLTYDEAMSVFNKGRLEEDQYRVQSRDVLESIASKYGMSTAQLLKRNVGFTEQTTLQPGDELNVMINKPIVEIETHYESKRTETIPFKKIAKEDASLYKGNQKVMQQGIDGEKVVTELIRKRDGHEVGKSVQEEKVVTEKQDEVVLVGTKVIPSRGEGIFKWPASGGHVSSQMGERWGALHRGIDIARPTSRTVVAADHGVVTSAGWHSTYGNKVVINHKNGYETLYAHMSSIDVTVGQTLPQGTAIGIMGSTGRSTGIHLHFEVTKNGTLVNPLSVLGK